MDALGFSFYAHNVAAAINVIFARSWFLFDFKILLEDPAKLVSSIDKNHQDQVISSA